MKTQVIQISVPSPSPSSFLERKQEEEKETAEFLELEKLAKTQTELETNNGAVKPEEEFGEFLSNPAPPENTIKTNGVSVKNFTIEEIEEIPPGGKGFKVQSHSAKEIDKEEIDKEEIDKEEIGKEKIGKEEIGEEKISEEKISEETISEEKISEEKIGKEEISEEKIDKEEISGVDNKEVPQSPPKKEELPKEPATRWKMVVASIVLALFIVPTTLGIFAHYLWKRFGPVKKSSGSKTPETPSITNDKANISQEFNAFGLFFRKDIGTFVCTGSVKPLPVELAERAELDKVPEKLRNRLFK